MKIKEGFVAQPIGDKLMVVSTGELAREFHGMIELNATAAEIWRGIEAGKTAEQIAEALSSEYGIGADKAISDVNKIIAQMLKNGILVQD